MEQGAVGAGPARGEVLRGVRTVQAMRRDRNTGGGTCATGWEAVPDPVRPAVASDLGAPVPSPLVDMTCGRGTAVPAPPGQRVAHHIEPRLPVGAALRRTLP